MQGSPLEDLLARGRTQRSLSPGEASELCREVLSLARGLRPERALAEALYALSRDYMTFGRAAEAGLVAEAALEGFEPEEPQLWQAEAWSILGAVRRHQGQHAAAAEIARKVIELSRHLGVPVLEATAYNNLAIAVNAMGDHDQALTSYLQALAVLESLETLESRRLRMFMHANVADIHADARDYLRAAEYQERALELLKDMKQPVTALRLGRKRSVCLRKARRPEQARAQLVELLPLMDASDHRDTSCEQILADLALLDGDLPRAALHYRRTLDQLRDLAPARALPRLQLDLAAVLPPTDPEAVALAQSAWQFACTREGSEGLRCDTLEVLSVQHEARGDLAAALRCAREAAALQQALIEQARRREQSELQARFDLAQRSWEARWHRAQAEELSQRVEERTRELEAARDRAQAADRMKVGFLAAASHELRTPLNAIIGYGELILEELGEAQELSEPAARLLASAECLLQLVDRILQMTNLEAGATRAHPAPVPIPSMLASVIGAVQRRSERHNEMSWSCPSDLGEPVTDATLLRSVLFNLVENADKFTHQGQIRVRARREAELLVISVEDTGIGMTPEQLERLFQLFTQIESGFTRRFGGLGLGLALGRRYCQLLGGDLTVQSEASRGSIFEIHLPFARA